MQLKFENPSRK